MPHLIRFGLEVYTPNEGKKGENAETTYIYSVIVGHGNTGSMLEFD